MIFLMNTTTTHDTHFSYFIIFINIIAVNKIYFLDQMSFSSQILLK